MKRNPVTNIPAWLEEPTSIAPLVTFRVVIGAMMAFSTIRFWALGWIDNHFVQPKLHFHYYGFEWVKPLPEPGMYVVHIALIVSSLFVMLGLFYRLAAVLQFLLFTYTELIDITYYLNHYYFVSIVCGLLIIAPANRSFSLDVWRNAVHEWKTAPRWSVLMFKFQLGLVYFYAGLWKINKDWLLHALPLKIWLPAQDQLPLIGLLFRYDVTAYVFSWFGMLYDSTIPFWLSWSRTRLLAYLAVIVFHAMTGLLFQIGIFPVVMIGATLIFFSDKWHERWQQVIKSGLNKSGNSQIKARGTSPRPTPAYLWAPLLLFFLFQILFPWRYLLYPGNVFWTEEGYRFSWRVMLMEKAGTAQFYIKDGSTGREGQVFNSEFLNPHQEKQMAMQPDLILQFAHFLKKYYTQQGVNNPLVRAEVYVTLNARPSQLLIDPNIDLTRLHDGWAPKKWIMPYEPK